MKFSIRDDDTCYFTSPEDLINAYSFLDENDVVSYAIVPNSVPKHKELMPYGKYEYKNYPIDNNIELISFLKKKVANGTADILLHGYSHEYKQNSKGKWLSEFEWKNANQLDNEISIGKEKLATLFGKQVSVFVPPNNHINKIGISAIEKNKLDLSGIILLNDRKISICYIVNFVKRWLFRLTKGFPYPGVLKFRKHNEINAFPLDSFERMKKEYLYCKMKNIPFVIYTHYWSLLENNSEHKRLLIEMVDFMKNDGAKCVSLSSIFEEYRK